MMTSRERWLAALQMEPVDRLPFWPKLDPAYPLHQKKPFSTMHQEDIQQWIGSDRQVGGIPRTTKDKRSKTELIVEEHDDVQRTVFRTEQGELELVKKFDYASQAHHPMVFPIKTLNDIKTMTAFYEDWQVEPDWENIEEGREFMKQLGQDGVSMQGIGESPLMYFVEWLAGIENAHYLLADYQEEVEALFHEIQRVLMDHVKIYAEHSPADLLYFVENTSTTLISPDQYKKYCYGHLQEYASILKEYNRIFVLHMCGHLKALLPELSKVGASAFEAFTSPPVGNTKLLDGRTSCPDKCLIGGTNATLWTLPAHAIIAELEKDLSALPHQRGIVITSAGVMPPLCSPETIKEVFDWVKSYRLN